jgi:2-polyprenyl-6-methoxyphenol hydroxylase-like FAD-dependent oxidoreductase
MNSTTASQRTPVLVVGAGPVGLVTAIRLRLQGMQVRVIDDQPAASKRTYPVVLHPRTLQLLDGLGLSAPLTWRGRFIKHLAVFADNLRRVVLDLPSAEEVAPGAMTLPQDVLRQALMQRLSTLGTEVEWQTRLVALEQDRDRVRVELVRREQVEGKAPELKPEWLDVAAETATTEFVVGADGRSSTVRKALGIELVEYGEHETYVFYDAPDRRAGDEAHLVLAARYGNTVYPLQGGLSRFSFRVAVPTPQAPGILELGRLLADRLRWYGAEPGAFEWSGMADFQPALATSFGDRRVWLAGDAAHCTGPLGGQSLNVGMQEGHDLAMRMAESLSERRYPLGTGYAAQRRAEWSRLLGLGPNAPNLAHAPAWVARNMSQLLPSLPVSGDDLDDVLEQLRVRTA